MILGRTAKGDLRLPEDAATQPFGILGRRGSGKSYVAGVLVEGLLDARQQVVILDPVGTHWGLRLLADGKSPGFAIPVFGGAHGDVPIEPGAGALLADLVIDKALSAVLDVSELRKGARKDFVTAFAEQLFHRKKKERSPIHLVLEEAQVFAPQQCGPDEKRMLGAIEDLVRLGRNYGIGASLLSQRPQSVNKEVLSQVECLIVLQTSGAHERKAIDAWVVEHGVDVAAMVRELPSLAQGEAFVWSPQWLRRLERVRIAKKRTFDASATPTKRERAVEPRQLEAGELQELLGAMAAVVKRAEESDPAKLRRRIAELERQMAEAVGRKIIADPAALERSREAGRAEGAREAEGRMAHLVARVQARDGRTARALEAALVALQKAADAVREPLDVELAPAPTSSARAARQARALKDSPPRRAPRPEPEKRGALGAERRLLAVLTSRHPARFTRAQLGTLAGLAHSGGTFSTYLSRLRSAGLLEEEGDLIGCSADGLEAVGEAPPAPSSPEEIQAVWRRALGAGAAGRLLDALIAQWPEWMSRTELAEACRLTAGAGTFGTYLSRLRSNGLLEERGQELRASAVLMGEA